MFNEGLTFAWRELVVRRSRLSAYHLRETGQTVYLRQVRRQGGGYVNAVVERLGLVDPAASGPGPAKERS